MVGRRVTNAIPGVEGIDWPDDWDAEPTAEPSTDVETFGSIKLAELAEPMFRGRYRYCKQLGWLAYDGTKWLPDAEARALAGLVKVIREYTKSILTKRPALTRDDCQELRGFASGSTQTHALKILRGIDGIETDYRLFDALPAHGRPWTLPCANGVTIELYADGSRKVRPTGPNDLNTKTACAYDPEAKAPNIAAAFALYQPDVDVRRYQMQLWCRGLSGMGAENFIANIGPGGGNGKGTMWGCVAAAGGDYAAELPVDIIIKQPRGAAREVFRSELAQLRGCRLLFCEEPDEGAQYDLGILKKITGGGKLDGRAMRMDKVEFEAKWLFEMAANSRPGWKADGAMTRRYVEIAWNFSIQGSVPGGGQEDFKEALKAEASGFLNAILDQWTGTRKPVMPEVVRRQTESGVAAASPLAAFAGDALVTKQGGEVQASALYDVYLSWCSKHGVKMPMTVTKFGREMPRLGYPKKTGGSANFYLGLTVADEYDVATFSFGR